MRYYFKILIICSSLLLILNISFATTMKSFSIEEIVRQSDEIILGECVAKSSNWVNGRIETTIHIKVSEVLLGRKKAGDTFEITQVGGEMQDPPIGQYIPMMPCFYEGEKTLLFLSSKQPKKEKDKKKPNSKSKIATSPYVVGLYQGKYTIIEDDKTGKKYAVRRNLGRMNMVPKDDFNRKLDRALSAQIKMSKDGLLTEDNKTLTPETVDKLKKNNETQQELKKNAAISQRDKNSTQETVQKDSSKAETNIKVLKEQNKIDSLKDLDTFKSEIKEYLKKIQVK